MVISLPEPVRRIVGRVLHLRLAKAGVAAVEFALTLPLFVLVGIVGTEIAYMASVNMQVSQVALTLADNASRLGQTDNSSVMPTVTESDIDSVMSGAVRQGESFSLGENGRIILSSLEYDSFTGRQYIHWQRCTGSLERESRYGDDGENNGLGSTEITGVGLADSKISAPEGSAVMVAEVYYEYEGLFTGFLDFQPVFRQEAIFAIRDDRNLTPGVTGSGGSSQCS